MSKYFEKLRATLEGVVARLTAKGIAPHHLAFGGEGRMPERKPTVPTDARSEFLANRAMGDWAEQTLTAALPAEVDLSARSHDETEALVKRAVAAIEVRSSKFEA